MKREFNRIVLQNNLTVLTTGLLLLAIGLAHLWRLQRDLTNQQFKNILADNRSYVEHELAFVNRNLELLADLSNEVIYRSPPAPKTFSKFAEKILQPYQVQYNSYFALEPKYAKKYFNKNAVVVTTHRTSPESQKFVSETWPSSNYQNDQNEVWYHVTKNARGPQYTKPYFDNSYMKKWMVSAGLGIYRDGEFTGMVGIDVLLEALANKLKDAKLGESGGLALIDPNTRDNLISPISQNFPSSGTQIKDQVLSEIRDKNGDSWIVYAQQLKEAPWMLVAYQKSSEVYQPVWQATVTSAFLGLLMILFSYAFARRMNQAHTRVLKMLEEQQARTVHSSKLASMGEMAGGIAHEINNPLAIISGSVRKLKRVFNHSSDEINAELGRIESTVERMNIIVKGLRFFAREGTNDPMEETPVIEIVQNSLSLCQERFKNHGVQLDVQLKSQAKIKCRPVQISQVIINLLNNAFDATNGLDKRVVEMIVKDKGAMVEIIVRDNGHGISDESKIFDPFYTTKQPGSGTGLGLSISKGIVESHNGQLRLTSKIHPTEFTISLPIIQLVMV